MACLTSYYRDSGAPKPNGPRRIGVTALIEREETVLVERRADNVAEEWAFIGGGLGDDDSLLGALHREVLEETGFELAHATLFGVFSDPTRIVAYPDGNVCSFVSIVFRVVPQGTAEPVLSNESREMRFIRRAELATIEFWPAHRPIRDAYLEFDDRVIVA